MNRLAAALSALLLASAPRFAAADADDLRKALDGNPDLVLAALKKSDKGAFFEFVMAAQRDHQAKQRAEKEAKDKKELEAAFKNPYTPALDAKTRVRGDAAAPITIVEYSDFQCPVCGRGYQVVEQVRRKYGAKVRFVYKHLPLVALHPMAMPAAQWQEAVALQSPDKAWLFHDALFKNQGSLSEDFLKKTAAGLGLDVERAAQDAHGRPVAEKIKADSAEAAAFGFTGTPGFLVNGVPIRGLSRNPTQSFDTIIARLGL